MSTCEAMADLLSDAMSRAATPACVGIDPVLERLPEAAGSGDAADAIARFGQGVVDAAAGIVGVVKPQAACFERFGSPGVAALERVIARARAAGLFVVLDVKRGDIGETSAHYAAAAARAGAHAVTLSPYMGPSAIGPFLDAALMAFVLVRTSNADAGAIQQQPLANGASIAEHVASLVGRWGAGRVGAAGLSAVGAVVGATHPAEGAAIRTLLPDAPFLVPGVGAQGGAVDQLGPMRRADRRSAGSMGLVINASRSVLYPANGADGPDWVTAIAQRAKAFAEQCRALAER